jgi:HD superfamily phosphohydrolase
MEIRDPLHGPIAITESIIPILENPYVQRLRSIKQLGLSEFIFPGATHTRFLHSIGVMHLSEKVFQKLFYQNNQQKKYDPNNIELQRFQETLKLAALLHDIGHAPLSHSTEMVMPELSELKIPAKFLRPLSKDEVRQANHEDYTLKMVIDSSLTDEFKSIKNSLGVTPESVASLITGINQDSGQFIFEGEDYFPLFHQLISSELDCDRMDYLLRDSYFCGVSYGKYDLPWIIDNLRMCHEGPGHNSQYRKVSLGISERAVSTFDDFLLCRYHMFLMVYYHYRSVCLEQLLSKYFASSQDEYVIPSSIEDYLKHDDYHLRQVIVKSQNPYAKMIVKNEIPEKIYESFGGKNYEQENEVYEDLVGYCTQHQIDFIKSTSLGRLSKYYQQEDQINSAETLKVIKAYPKNGQPSFIPIHEATDLFQKYGMYHQINRIYVWMKNISSLNSEKLLEIIKG